MGVCNIKISQELILNNFLDLPIDKRYEIIASKVDCDGNLVLCITGNDLPERKENEEIPYGNVICERIKSHIEFYSKR